MLRITRINRDGQALLKLEGKFLAPWVDEVREQVSRARSEGRIVALDLSQVSFADSAGQVLLRELLTDGASLSACSFYLRELLKVEKP